MDPIHLPMNMVGSVVNISLNPKRPEYVRPVWPQNPINPITPISRNPQFRERITYFPVASTQPKGQYIDIYA